MKKQLAAALLALSCIGAAQAQFSSASLPIPPVPAPGSSQNNPILPGWTSTPGQGSQSAYFYFQGDQGSWFAAAMFNSDGFQIGSDEPRPSFSFAEIKAPMGFENLTVSVNGQVLSSDFDGGMTLQFAPGTLSFDITGLQNGIVAGQPLPTNFPLYIKMLGSASAMVWTNISAAVPETDTYVMMMLGMGLLGCVLRRPAAKA